MTIRAVRLASPLRLDGRLDDPVYATVRPISDFIQTEPHEDVPATEKTEVWIFFDEDNVYVAARCWESQPQRMVVNVMQRDHPNIMQNENFSFMFDPFYDRRSTIVFVVNPIGGRTDGQSIDGQWNRDLNMVWDVKLARFEGGWSLEVAVPFKSLRFRPGREQIWGFNARRVDRWKNEISHLVRVPNSMSGSGLFHASFAATVVGLEAPARSNHLEIKPFGISTISPNRATTSNTPETFAAAMGVDAKYGVTQNLTADFTFNSDFAQVEADEQQVNLTRFSLFFPEKREFFLENQGLFGFGGAAATSVGDDVPILFYSRRIGLSQGRVVPIEAGGRLTGRVGRYRLGVLNIETGNEPVGGTRPTAFSVMRLKRDIMRRSSVGLLYARRSTSESAVGSTSAFGADGTFAFFDNLFINTYWAQTRTAGTSGGDTSYRAQLDYAGSRYGARLERLVVGDHFNPEIGFVRRAGIRGNYGRFRFSPRPQSIKSVRRFSSMVTGAYVENGAGRLETSNLEAEFAVDFQNSDKFSIGYERNYELLTNPFHIAPGIDIPVGDYDFGSTRVAFNFGQHRRVFGNLVAERGTFYGGQKSAISFSAGRAMVSSQLSIEPTVSVNAVRSAEASFVTTLGGSRITHTISPLMFVSALLQYSSAAHALTVNARLRWEYRPGSELFVVYNEEQDTLAGPLRAPANRALIVKANRLLRF